MLGVAKLVAVREKASIPSVVVVEERLEDERTDR